MIDVNTIKPDMPVVCSLDGKFAEVDHLEGANTIKLKRDTSGHHHYIPVSWVVSTANGKVKVNKTGEEAMQKWSTTPPTN